MIYRCSKCGNSFKEKYEFCPFCGAKLNYPKETVAPVVKPQPVPTQIKSKESPTKAGQILTFVGYGIALLTLLTICLLGLIGAIIELNTFVSEVPDALYGAIPYVLYALPITGLVISIIGSALRGRRPISTLGVVFNALLTFAAFNTLIIRLAIYY